jgi:hypothetical protein
VTGLYVLIAIVFSLTSYQLLAFSHQLVLLKLNFRVRPQHSPSRQKTEGES